MDQHALRKSRAGMRFIAQMTLYNQLNAANAHRLHAFLRSSYDASLLDERDSEARLTDWQALYEQVGRVKVQQVLATSDHQVIVLLQTEHSADLWLNEVRVSEEYPHLITAHSLRPMSE